MNRKRAEVLALDKARKKSQDEEEARRRTEELNKEEMDAEQIDFDKDEVREEPGDSEDQDYTVSEEQPPVKKRRSYESTKRVEDDKNLESYEYAENLKVYLNRIKSNAAATLDDFRGALDNLSLEWFVCKMG